MLRLFESLVSTQVDVVIFSAKLPWH